MPASSSTAVVERTSLVSRAMRAQRRLPRASPTIATPRPPRKIRTPRGTKTNGSSANPLRLAKPPIRSKPALLNAEIEWNRPCHAAFATSP